ncbi:unnamed protein product [Closterium sp. Naga37s-1]|nr:unnamed protein product [Closterium sp. Naga37s-1]
MFCSDGNRRNTQGGQQAVFDKRPSDGATSSEPAEGANVSAAGGAGDTRDRQAGGANGKHREEGAVLTEVEQLLRRGTPLSLREFQRLNELLRQHVAGGEDERAAGKHVAKGSEPSSVDAVSDPADALNQVSQAQQRTAA